MRALGYERAGRARDRDPAARRAPGRRAHGLGVPLARRRVPRARARARAATCTRTSSRTARSTRPRAASSSARCSPRSRVAHDAGFVFADLKPENVVITESGHVKLTDFGACRPSPPRRPRSCAAAATRCARCATATGARATTRRRGRRRGRRDRGGDAARAVRRGRRLGRGRRRRRGRRRARRGRPLYLPPEVVRDGERPALAADAWSLGCVRTTACAAGRPCSPSRATTRSRPSSVLDASEPSAARRRGRAQRSTTTSASRRASRPPRARSSRG